MTLTEEDRLILALDRTKVVDYPPDYPDYARQIEEEFNARGYNRKATNASIGWRQASETATKLKTVMTYPNLHDPDGSLRIKYENLLRSFNLQTGMFKVEDDL